MLIFTKHNKNGAGEVNVFNVETLEKRETNLSFSGITLQIKNIVNVEENVIIFGGDPVIDRYYYMFLDEEELEIAQKNEPSSEF